MIKSIVFKNYRSFKNDYEDMFNIGRSAVIEAIENYKDKNNWKLDSFVYMVIARNIYTYWDSKIRRNKLQYYADLTTLESIQYEPSKKHEQIKSEIIQNFINAAKNQKSKVLRNNYKMYIDYISDFESKDRILALSEKYGTKLKYTENTVQKFHQFVRDHAEEIFGEKLPVNNKCIVNKKKCTKCRKLKPAQEFYLQDGTDGKYCRHCTVCLKRAVENARLNKIQKGKIQKERNII